MANFSFFDAQDVIYSGQPYTLGSVATSWRNFGEALRNASSHTQGTSDTVSAQTGDPYQQFGNRAAPIASWLNGVSSNADQVAAGLDKAHQVGTTAQFEAATQDATYRQTVDRILGPEDALSAGRANAMRQAEARGAVVLNKQIDNWGAAYDSFQPGTIGAAPTTNGGSGNQSISSASARGTNGGTNGGVGPTSTLGTTSGGTNGTTGSHGVGDPATAQPISPVANGGSNSDFPISSVVGNGGGDFAGWVRDPNTGFLINPQTGQEFDPVHNQWIDPVTGKPFGDVVNQATRLEGVTGGTSTSGGLFGNGGNLGLVTPLPPGGGSGGPGGGGFIPPNMWGGALPPSLDPRNPAARQLTQTALDRMAVKAYAAEQLAIRESQQGGRPYLPPTQAGGGGGMFGSRTLPRSRLSTEPEGTWTGRPGGRSTRGGVTEGEMLANGARGGRTSNTGGRWIPNSGGAGAGAKEESDKKRKSRRESFPNGEAPLLDDNTLGEGGDGSDNGHGGLGTLGTVGLIGTAGVAGGLTARNAFGGGGRFGENGSGQPYLPGPGGTGAAGARGGRSGSRAGSFAEEGGAAGRGGSAERRSYLPPMQGGQSRDEKDRKRQRPDWLTEDDIWSAGTHAGPAVLGED